jgi:hypothetical protein
MLSAIGSCTAGRWEWENEACEIERYAEANHFYMGHILPGANLLQIIGLALFLLSIAVGLAAYMLWREDRNESL